MWRLLWLVYFQREAKSLLAVGQAVQPSRQSPHPVTRVRTRLFWRIPKSRGRRLLQGPKVEPGSTLGEHEKFRAGENGLEPAHRRERRHEVADVVDLDGKNSLDVRSAV